jgi:hypothetical protein
VAGGAWLIYRHRETGIVAPVSLFEGRAPGQWTFSGILDRLPEYGQARVYFNIPRRLGERIRLEEDGAGNRVIVDNQTLDSTLVFASQAFNVEPPDAEYVAGVTINREDIVDFVALNDPLPLIPIALGAIVVICLAQLVTSAVVVNAAHRRLTEAGAQPTLDLSGSSGEDIEVQSDGSPKLRLNCKLKASVRPTRRLKEVEPEEFDLVES